MHTRSKLHIALSLTAIAGWLLFILGCTGWPAWSPNGSKILFTYTVKDDGDVKASIAVYDLPTGQVRTLFKCPEGEGPCSAQWRSTGMSALVFANDGDKKVAIFEVPIDDGGPARKIASVDQTEGLLPPVPEINGALFFPGKPPKQVDLDSGATKTLPEVADSTLHPWNGERALYMRSISGSESSGRVEVGELHATSREPLYEIATSDPALGKPAKLPGFPATDPERSLFALVAQYQERDEILVFDRTGFRQRVKPKMPAGTFHLGNMEWARDGQSIFASVVQPLKNDDAQWSLAEVSLRSGSVHLVPIARLKITDADFYDTLCILLEISLSPDGRTIAASSALYDPDNIAPADRGLFLIDVGSRDERRVTKIPISSLQPGVNQ